MSVKSLRTLHFFCDKYVTLSQFRHVYLFQWNLLHLLMIWLTTSLPPMNFTVLSISARHGWLFFSLCTAHANTINALLHSLCTLQFLCNKYITFLNKVPTFDPSSNMPDSLVSLSEELNRTSGKGLEEHNIFGTKIRWNEFRGEERSPWPAHFRRTMGKGDIDNHINS